MNVSSLDFRNSYEKFYVAMRNYLWPYQVIIDLGEVEADIYSAFIDIHKLSSDFSRLSRAIKDVCNDDDELAVIVEDLQDLIDLPDAQPYLRIARVNEVNQENPKQIRTIPAEGEEEL